MLLSVDAPLVSMAIDVNTNNTASNRRPASMVEAVRKAPGESCVHAQIAILGYFVKKPYHQWMPAQLDCAKMVAHAKSLKPET